MKTLEITLAALVAGTTATWMAGAGTPDVLVGRRVAAPPVARVVGSGGAHVHDHGASTRETKPARTNEVGAVGSEKSAPGSCRAGKKGGHSMACCNPSHATHSSKQHRMPCGN